jgi:hypothetical protein
MTSPARFLFDSENRYVRGAKPDRLFVRFPPISRIITVFLSGRHCRTGVLWAGSCVNLTHVKKQIVCPVLSISLTFHIN